MWGTVVFTNMDRQLNELEVGDSEKRALEGVKGVIDDLIAGKKDKVAERVSKWKDVNDTILVSQKLADFKKSYRRKDALVHFVQSVVALATAFVPELAPISAAVDAVVPDKKKKTKKSSSKKKKTKKAK